MNKENYLELNQQSWNNKVDVHIHSTFYDMQGFEAGNTSLKEIELALLGDIQGKKILHLQCHFGQDTLSLARMGAEVTGIDLSDKAIEKAKEISSAMKIPCGFVCTDVYSVPDVITEQFDMVFTSYGTIGWLPDLDQWAAVIQTMLKPGGKFIFVEFHPVVWMFDDDFNEIAYSYFNQGEIIETETGTYANRDADIQQKYICWNHSLSEVFQALTHQKIEITDFREYAYSPYPCFKNTQELEKGRFTIKSLKHDIPMVYSLIGLKK
ncbi:MAG: class I SAM-dependent methyltransferase [Bacteroidia bacterium]